MSGAARGCNCAEPGRAGKEVRSVRSLPGGHCSTRGRHLDGDLHTRGRVSIFTGNTRFTNTPTTRTRSDTFPQVLFGLDAACGSFSPRHGLAAPPTRCLAGAAPGTHRFGLRVMRAEEADDAGPTAHVQDHLAPQGLSVLQDHVVVLSGPWLVRQHLQVELLQEKREGSHRL